MCDLHKLELEARQNLPRALIPTIVFITRPFGRLNGIFHALADDLVVVTIVDHCSCCHHQFVTSGSSSMV